MISPDQLQEMFDAIRTNPKVGWNVDGVCLWGYFFTDRDETRLAAAASSLSRFGYRVVGLLHPTPEDDDQGIIVLHVEKEEQHDVGSLHKRNTELYHLATQLGLESYDGMDVGPVEAPGA
jgi:hypothetical protein